MSTRTFFVPPEWAPQAALWVGWPHLREEWDEAFDGARAEIAGFIRAAAKYVPVRVACGSPEAQDSAQKLVGMPGSNCACVSVPAGDIWLRDTGPIVAAAAGQPVALQFQFNGWGGKYVMPGDTETAEAIAAFESIPVRQHDIILEGGAIDLDGQGRLATTRQCLLNPNRNAGWDEAAATGALKATFNVGEVIWLGDGLANDHTDGHVDNIARFIGPGHALCQRPSGPDDPNREVLGEIEAQLRDAGLAVSTLPSPGRIGDDLPASHMNFTITNGAVLLPIYEDTYSCEAAAILAELFPGRDIVPLPAGHILAGGGSFHCMTREIPDLQGDPAR